MALVHIYRPTLANVNGGDLADLPTCRPACLPARLPACPPAHLPLLDARLSNSPFETADIHRGKD